MRRKQAAKMKAGTFYFLVLFTVGYFGAVSAEKANCTKDESYAAFQAAMDGILSKYGGRPCKEDTEPEVMPAIIIIRYADTCLILFRL